jgi:hypothetical protein
MALIANIRIGWKGLPDTNTLAYWTHYEVRKRKVGSFSHFEKSKKLFLKENRIQKF